MIPPIHVEPSDPDFLRILNARLAMVTEAAPVMSVASIAGAAVSLAGSHDQRMSTYRAQDLPSGSTFFETDRTTTYMVVPTGVGDEHVWEWYSGQMSGTLSPNQKPTLTVDDDGFLFYSTDFDHHYQWSGTAWDYAGADECSGWVKFWAQAPQKTNAWAIADGSTVTKSTRTGGTASITLPDLMGCFVKGAAAYTGTPVAGSSSLTITGDTDDETGHTHAVTGTATQTILTGAVNQGAGAAVILPGETHTHPVTGTAAATTHKHGTTGMSISGSADPDHLEMIPYYRL